MINKKIAGSKNFCYRQACTYKRFLPWIKQSTLRWNHVTGETSFPAPSLPLHPLTGTRAQIRDIYTHAWMLKPGPIASFSSVMMLHMLAQRWLKSNIIFAIELYFNSIFLKIIITLWYSFVHFYLDYYRSVAHVWVLHCYAKLRRMEHHQRNIANK